MAAQNLYSSRKQKDAEGNTVIEKELLKQLRGIRKDSKEWQKTRKDEDKRTEMERQADDHFRKDQNKKNSSSIKLLNGILNNKSNIARLDKLAANGDRMAQNFKNSLVYDKNLVNEVADMAAQNKDSDAVSMRYFGRWFSNMQDGLAVYGDKVEVGLKDLTAMMGETNDREGMKENIKLLADIIGNNLDKLSESMDEDQIVLINDHLRDLKEIAENPEPLTNEEKKYFSSTMASLGKVAGDLTTVNLSQKQLQEMAKKGLKQNEEQSNFFKQLLNLAEQLWGLATKGYFDIIAPGFGKLTTNLTRIYNDLKGAFIAFNKMFSPFVAKFWTNFKSAFPALTSLFEGMLRGVWSFLATISSAIFQVMLFVVQAVLLTAVGLMFYKLGGYIVDNFWEIIDFLKEGVILALKSGLNNVVNSLIFLKNLPGFIVDNFWEIITWLKDSIGLYFDILGEVFMDAIDMIPGAGRSDEEEAADEKALAEKTEKVLGTGKGLLDKSKVVDTFSKDRFGASESLAATGKAWDAIGTQKSALRTSMSDEGKEFAVPEVPRIMGQKALREINPTAPTKEGTAPPAVTSIQGNTAKQNQPSSNQPGRKFSIDDSNLSMLNLGVIA